MCPIVPMFTCGFDRSNFALAMPLSPSSSAVRPTFGEWSPCPGLNRRPRPYQGRALPTELHGPLSCLDDPCLSTPRPERLWSEWSGKRDSNPRPPAWKAGALPLSYSRVPSRRAVARPQSWWGEEDLNSRRRSPATSQTYTLSLHDALPISAAD